MIKQQDAIGRRGQALTQQLVQIAGAKIEGETNERGELVVSKGQVQAIDPSLSHSQILLQKCLGLLLCDGLARLHTLRMSITNRPNADAVLVGIQPQAFKRLDRKSVV